MMWFFRFLVKKELSEFDVVGEDGYFLVAIGFSSGGGGEVSYHTDLLMNVLVRFFIVMMGKLFLK